MTGLDRADCSTYQAGFRFAAVISYSHAVDGRLAPALVSGFHRFAKPWYRLRALRVFHDETSLAATPGLWAAIEGGVKRAASSTTGYLRFFRVSRC